MKPAPRQFTMGYLIASIVAVIILVAVALLFLNRGRPGQKVGGSDRSEKSQPHGIGPEEPQDEGATLPQALDRKADVRSR